MKRSKIYPSISQARSAIRILESLKSSLIHEAYMNETNPMQAYISIYDEIPTSDIYSALRGMGISWEITVTDAQNIDYPMNSRGSN